MPVARFQMPDGKIARFEVPEGTTPEQAQAMISRQMTQRNQPELRQGPLDFISNPTSNVSPVSDSSKMADMSTQAVGSLPKDVKERAAYFAKQRFPNDPNGIAKYGVQDGRLFYEGDDGQYYFEEPELSLSQSGKYLASSAGPALPVAGAIAGGMAGPAGGIPGAMIGGAAGDEMRQGLAMSLAGQKQFDPSQTGGEALIAGGGQAGGRMVGGMMNRNAVRDVSKIQNPEAQAGINDLMSKAKQENITLFPAEITDLPSLKTQQKYLSQTSRSGDIMNKAYDTRNKEQIPAAMDRMLGRISPVESAEVGAKSLREGAKDAISSEAAERSAAAKPFYDKSRNVAIPAKSYQELMKDPFLAKQIRSVRNNPKYQSDIGDLFPKEGRTTSEAFVDSYGRNAERSIMDAPIEAKVGYLDVVKKRIDGMIETAKTSGNKNDVRIFQNAKEKLLKVTDEASPDYAKARSIFEEGSPAVNALTKGEVGLAAGAKETNLSRIPKIIFESGPDAVKANRTAYVKAGKEQEWNDGLRSYLQSTFDTAAKEFKTGNTNPGASFRAKVFGTAKQKAAMQNAMSPEQWAGFNRLMDVLEASGRVTTGGSQTHFMGEVSKEMESQAMGISGKAAQNILDAPGIPRRLGNWVKEMKTGKYNEALANIVTSPDAMRQLKQLKTLKPGSIKATAVVSQLLTQYGVSSEPDDAPVGGFSNPQ